MENKSKLLILVSVVICVALVFVLYQTTQTYNLDKKKYSEEIDKLRQDKEAVVGDFNRAKDSAKIAQKKLEEIQNNLIDLSGERDEWKNKYEEAQAQREEFENKISELERAASRQPQVAQKEISEAPVVYSDSHWADLVKERASLEITVADLKQELETMVIRVDELTKENTELNQELDKINRLKTDLERQVAYNQKLTQTLSDELVREKNDKRVFINELDKIKQDYAIVEQQLKDSSDEKLVLSKEQQGLKEENKVLARKISELDQVLQDRMSEIIKVKDQLTDIRTKTDKSGESQAGAKVVELPAIVVKADERTSAEAVPAEKLSGSVLAINKDNNFVVIDIGETAGVRSGMQFNVYRNDQKIASLEIIQVRRDISAADIKYLANGQQIKVADIVKN